MRSTPSTGWSYWVHQFFHRPTLRATDDWRNIAITLIVEEAALSGVNERNRLFTYVLVGRSTLAMHQAVVERQSSATHCENSVRSD